MFYLVLAAKNDSISEVHVMCDRLDNLSGASTSYQDH
jgi:hypothetical protein